MKIVALLTAGIKNVESVFTQIDCDDYNACTYDICGGYCSYTDIDCDDACTDDSCNSGSGSVLTTVIYDDKNVCTFDICDYEHGCENTPYNDNYCNDYNECTIKHCDKEDGCVYEV